MLLPEKEHNIVVYNNLDHGTEDFCRTALNSPSFFETMRSNEGNVPLWPQHAARIRKSAEYLWGVKITENNLLHIWNQVPFSGIRRIKLTFSYHVAKGIFLFCEQNELEISSDQLSCGLSRKVRLLADQEHSFVKSTSRLHYQIAEIERQASGCDELILVNHHGHPTEGIIHNLFVLFGERLLTPPLQSGCIAGVCRAAILEKAHESGLQVEERVLFLSDLLQAEGVLLSNALRGFRVVKQIENEAIRTETAEIVAKKMNHVLFH